MRRTKHSREEVERRCQVRAMRREQKQKKGRPLAGFLIAGASLAALFGMAFIKAQADTGETAEEEE